MLESKEGESRKALASSQQEIHARASEDSREREPAPPATLEEEEQRVAEKLTKRFGLHQLIGQSAPFLAIKAMLTSIAQHQVSVLILGETGTGKELVARAIHYLSPRHAQPFSAVNCGAIPVDLIENELFGHSRGAFTGAATAATGLIQEADGGTLFLDEIDCLPSLAQVKLLRFLQEKEYRPLGSAQMRRADVRVIAATNTNLEDALKQGHFRHDLYYRLNVIPVTLPALRDRPDDIPLLACHFLAKCRKEFSKPPMDFTAEALRRLQSYDWPGNVRELEHVVERAIVLAQNPRIEAHDLRLPLTMPPPSRLPFREAKIQVVTQFERSYIEELLAEYQGNISRAARAARKDRRAFWHLMRKHGIPVPRSKNL